jgi:hypothetical protein
VIGGLEIACEGAESVDESKDIIDRYNRLMLHMLDITNITFQNTGVPSNG